MTDPNPAWPARTEALRIGEVVIDLRYRHVRRPDGEVELPHRIFELLLLFVAEPRVVHTRQDLLRRVWPGLVVEDANLSQSVWSLRKALGDAHKDWIRTVSKKGYVFEPPMAIEPVPGPAPLAEGADVPPAVAPRRRLSMARARRWRWQHVATALMLVAVVGLGLRLKAGPARAAPTAVALVEVDDPGLAAGARVPAALLSAWLEWKLGALPELSVLSQADLAARPPSTAVVVLLSSGSLPTDPSRIFVQARIETPDGPRSIQHDGAPNDVAALVDRTSVEVLRALVPARADQPWPRLEVDPGTAQRYVELRRARQAREWIRAASIGQSLARQAPGFALGRLHMAQTLATLGQLPPALEHLEAARTRLHPVPADVAQILDAQRLALSPEHAAAAAAYAALAARYPEQPAFAIQQARALGRTGRFADAKSVLLADAAPTAWPLATRLQWLTVRARMESALGDYAAARTSAATAVQLGEAAGEGWAYERGQALLALADAQVAGGQSGAVNYERAATRFARAGDTFSALHARFAGEIAGPYHGPLDHLDAWLAQTRAAGQRQLELGALRGAAFHYFRAGDLPRYRERLGQAATIAEAINDQWGLTALSVDVLNDDFTRGRHAQVERRLARFRRNGVQGELGMWVSQFEALLANDRGQYAQALRAVEAGERLARAGRDPGAPPPAVTAMFACTRGSILLSQARGMEARNAYARCMTGKGSLAMNGQVGMAEVELMSGDREGALRRLRTVQSKLKTVEAAPDRWATAVDVGALLVRAGEAEGAAALLADVLPRIEAAGLHRTTVYAHLALAEVAMARESPALAALHLAAARSRRSEGLWIPRFEQLEIAIARARGDAARAEQALLALDREAHERDDTLAQLLAHSWMAPGEGTAACPPRERAALVARTGFHAARLDWLQREPPRLAAD